jgi:hypothetical protein
MQSKATGKDIILALLENMRESEEPLLYNTIVPSHYDVYLHGEDYHRLSSVFPGIIEEARTALTKEMSRLSKKGWPLLPGKKAKQSRYEAAEKDWFIKFHSDEDEELAPGDILVDSRLALAAPQDYGVGSKTQRTLTLQSGGETKKLKRYTQESNTEKPALARITYTDKEGRAHEYLMTSHEISVGRGGRTDYCDLELEAPPDISRQHFYLRHDAQTRAFFIQDVSKFGTSVNGRALTPKAWEPMPAKGTIRLADKLLLQFESL